MENEKVLTFTATCQITTNMFVKRRLGDVCADFHIIKSKYSYNINYMVNMFIDVFSESTNQENARTTAFFDGQLPP